MSSRRRFLFLTKTQWHEAPRLRHQLAFLLATAGHEIVFFDKPVPAWSTPAGPRKVTESITIVGHRELMHRKLRLAPLLHRWNATVVRRSLEGAIKAIGSDRHSIVVNFNYDYWFVRDVFPDNRIITVINDDFVSLALFNYTRPHRWAIARTCAGSDHVLAVSPQLTEQLSEFCRAELFPPWADLPYQRPGSAESRDTLLYWGYIDRTIDYDRTAEIADRLAIERPDLRLMFVGPVLKAGEPGVSMLAQKRNVQILPSTSLAELPLGRVLAGFIPYHGKGDPVTDAVGIPNKGPQLLARGLPLLITGMPKFLDKPFVFRLAEDGSLGALDQLRASFMTVQPSIEEYVQQNQASTRLARFLEIAGCD